MKGTRIARFARRMLFVSAVSLVASVIGASSAAADPCPVLDLGCVVEETTTTAGDVLEETTTTVGGAVEDTTTVVEEVLEDTTTTIGDTLPVDTGGVVPDVPAGVLPGGGGVLPGEGSLPPDTGGPGDGGTQPGPDTGVGSPTTGSQGLPTGRFPVTDPAIGPSSVVEVTPTEPRGRSTARVDVPGAGILSGARLVGTLAFPLILILMVVGFLAVQDRIDRKDPKLVLAPVGSEYLTFS